MTKFVKDIILKDVNRIQCYVKKEGNEISYDCNVAYKELYLNGLKDVNMEFITYNMTIEEKPFRKLKINEQYIYIYFKEGTECIIKDHDINSNESIDFHCRDNKS